MQSRKQNVTLPSIRDIFPEHLPGLSSMRPPLSPAAQPASHPLHQPSNTDQNPLLQPSQTQQFASAPNLDDSYRRYSMVQPQYRTQPPTQLPPYTVNIGILPQNIDAHHPLTATDREYKPAPRIVLNIPEFQVSMAAATSPIPAAVSPSSSDGGVSLRTTENDAPFELDANIGSGVGCFATIDLRSDDDLDETTSSPTRPSHTADGNDDKKHCCPHCNKRFNRPSSLNIHVNTHTGDKPFECPYPGCSRRFNVNSNMRRHYRNHINNRKNANAASNVEQDQQPQQQQVRSRDFIPSTYAFEAAAYSAESSRSSCRVYSSHTHKDAAGTSSGTHRANSRSKGCSPTMTEFAIIREMQETEIEESFSDDDTDRGSSDGQEFASAYPRYRADGSRESGSRAPVGLFAGRPTLRPAFQDGDTGSGQRG